MSEMICQVKNKTGPAKSSFFGPPKSGVRGRPGSPFLGSVPGVVYSVTYVFLDFLQEKHQQRTTAQMHRLFPSGQEQGVHHKGADTGLFSVQNGAVSYRGHVST